MRRSATQDQRTAVRWSFLRGRSCKLLNNAELWWARQDLNLGPTDYESAALTAELRAPCLGSILVHKRRLCSLLFARDAEKPPQEASRVVVARCLPLTSGCCGSRSLHGAPRCNPFGPVLQAKALCHTLRRELQMFTISAGRLTTP